MNIDLTDKKTIITSILEAGDVQRLSSCSTCNGDLSEVIGAAALLLCEKCHRHILRINVTQNTSTTLVLKNGTIVFISR
jgi:hypothetical protein